MKLALVCQHKMAWPAREHRKTERQTKPMHFIVSINAARYCLWLWCTLDFCSSALRQLSSTRCRLQCQLYAFALENWRRLYWLNIMALSKYLTCQSPSCTLLHCTLCVALCSAKCRAGKLSMKSLPSANIKCNASACISSAFAYVTSTAYRAEECGPTFQRNERIAEFMAFSRN